MPYCLKLLESQTRSDLLARRRPRGSQPDDEHPVGDIEHEEGDREEDAAAAVDPVGDLGRGHAREGGGESDGEAVAVAADAPRALTQPCHQAGAQALAPRAGHLIVGSNTLVKSGFWCFKEAAAVQNVFVTFP